MPAHVSTVDCRKRDGDGSGDAGLHIEPTLTIGGGAKIHGMAELELGGRAVLHSGSGLHGAAAELELGGGVVLHGGDEFHSAAELELGDGAELHGGTGLTARPNSNSAAGPSSMATAGMDSSVVPLDSTKETPEVSAMGGKLGACASCTCNIYVCMLRAFRVAVVLVARGGGVGMGCHGGMSRFGRRSTPRGRKKLNTKSIFGALFKCKRNPEELSEKRPQKSRARL